MKNNDTKTKIANSFKKLMKTKPISKITVTDIINDCKINRNTFYYHFEDICSLYKWIHEEDAISYVKNIDLVTNYEEAILFVINYLEKNKTYINSAFYAFNKNGTHRIFYDDFFYIVKKLVDTVEMQLELNLAKDYKHFVYVFYVEAVFGIIFSELQNNMTYDRQKAVNYFSTICKSSLPEILKNGPKI